VFAHSTFSAESGSTIDTLDHGHLVRGHPGRRVDREHANVCVNVFARRIRHGNKR